MRFFHYRSIMITTLSVLLLCLMGSCAKKKKDRTEQQTEEQGNQVPPPPVPQPKTNPNSGPLIPLDNEQKTTITGWSPRIPVVGDTVTLSGTVLDKIQDIALTGAVVKEFTIDSPDLAKFKLSAAARTGPTDLVVTARSTQHTKQIYLKSTDDGIPVYTGSSSDICLGSKFYDSNGAIQEGARNCGGTDIPACTGSGDTNCFVGAGNVAVPATDLLPDNIRNGTTVGGVTGTFPSAGTPMVPEIPAFGGELADNLNNPTPGELGFFDRAGGYHILKIEQAGNGEKIIAGVTDQEFRTEKSLYLGFTVAGDADLQPGNIRAGVNIFNVAGNLTDDTVACTADNQEGCLASRDFPSVRKSNISENSIAHGLSVAGVSGQSKYCRSGMNTQLFDNTEPPAQIGPDPFDGIDDYNNFGQLPTETAFGEKYLCNANGWLREPAGNECNSPNSDCIFRDRVTGLYWSELSPAGNAKTWNQAISGCDALVFGGLRGWRLPTQKELFQAYVNGIYGISKNFANFGSLRLFHWAATTVSTPANNPPEFLNAWMVDLSNGATSNGKKTLQREYRCVRED